MDREMTKAEAIEAIRSHCFHRVSIMAMVGRTMAGYLTVDKADAIALLEQIRPDYGIETVYVTVYGQTMFIN